MKELLIIRNISLTFEVKVYKNTGHKIKHTAEKYQKHFEENLTKNEEKKTVDLGRFETIFTYY